jgi:hypothetical protein
VQAIKRRICISLLVPSIGRKKVSSLLPVFLGQVLVLLAHQVHSIFQWLPLRVCERSLVLDVNDRPCVVRMGQFNGDGCIFVHGIKNREGKISNWIYELAWTSD